jgi:hypothetical protein
MSEIAGQASGLNILRMLRARVSRLADPETSLAALQEVHREVVKAVGERDRADYLFFHSLNLYDGTLIGFDWGWRAARWMRPKQIGEVDKVIIAMLIKNPELKNPKICQKLDSRGTPVTAKLRKVNERDVKTRLGPDSQFWTWERALEEFHGIESYFSDMRNEAKQFAEALTWQRTVSKHYRKHGKIDWAQRAAVIKRQVRKK